jgi:hypothetical protein
VALRTGHALAKSAIIAARSLDDLPLVIFP